MFLLLSLFTLNKNVFASTNGRVKFEIAMVKCGLTMQKCLIS